MEKQKSAALKFNRRKTERAEKNVISLFPSEKSSGQDGGELDLFYTELRPIHFNASARIRKILIDNPPS
jgi:hypothetical protein